MGSSCSQHGSRLANSQQPETPTQTTTSTQTGNYVERVDPTDAAVSERTSQNANIKGNLGLLDQNSPAFDEPLHPQESPDINLRKLTPGQLLAILNSTTLGTVISDRQLFRHRQHGNLDQHGKVIDFVFYVGWLRHQREQDLPKSNTMRNHQSRVQKNSKPPSADEILQLLEKQKFRCALTGRKLTPDTATLDHILPVCREGPHTIENAQVILKEVNRAKGTMTNEEFVDLCRAVTRHANRASSRQ